jgi:hypothetical protein
VLVVRTSRRIRNPVLHGVPATDVDLGLGLDV